MLFIHHIGVSEAERKFWYQVESSDNLLETYIEEAKTESFLKEYNKFEHKSPKYPFALSYLHSISLITNFLL